MNYTIWKRRWHFEHVCTHLLISYSHITHGYYWYLVKKATWIYHMNETHFLKKKIVGAVILKHNIINTSCYNNGLNFLPVISKAAKKKVYDWWHYVNGHVYRRVQTCGMTKKAKNAEKWMMGEIIKLQNWFLIWNCRPYTIVQIGRLRLLYKKKKKN